MQLIMDTENTIIDIKLKMSALDQESFIEKPIVNGIIDDNSVSVPKEIDQTKDNVTDLKENGCSDNNKQDEENPSVSALKNIENGSIKDKNDRNDCVVQENALNNDNNACKIKNGEAEVVCGKTNKDSKEILGEVPIDQQIDLEIKDLPDVEENKIQDLPAAEENKIQDLLTVKENRIEDLLAVEEKPLATKPAISEENINEVFQVEAIKQNICQEDVNMTSNENIEDIAEPEMNKQTIVDTSNHMEPLTLCEKVIASEKDMNQKNEGENTDISTKIAENSDMDVDLLINDEVVALEKDIEGKDESDKSDINSKALVSDKEIESLKNDVEIIYSGKEAQDNDGDGNIDISTKIDVDLDMDLLKRDDKVIASEKEVEDICKDDKSTRKQNDTNLKMEEAPENEANSINEQEKIQDQSSNQSSINLSNRDKNHTDDTFMECSDVIESSTENKDSIAENNDSAPNVDGETKELKDMVIELDETPMELDEINEIVSGANKEVVESDECYKVSEITISGTMDKIPNDIDMNINNDNAQSSKKDNDVNEVISKNLTQDDVVDDDVTVVNISKNNDICNVEETAVNKKVLLDEPVGNCDSEILDVDELKETVEDKTKDPIAQQETVIKKIKDSPITPLLRLCNTLDILSDDEEEPPKKDAAQNKSEDVMEKQCSISIEDDDDVMLIDEDTDKKDGINEVPKSETEGVKKDADPMCVNETTLESSKETEDIKESSPVKTTEKETETTVTTATEVPDLSPKPEIDEKKIENVSIGIEKPKPLVPDNFFKTYKKNLAEMTRDDLEEFCVLKIVESIIDRSSLNDIRTKLKVLAQNTEEYKKKTLMLTKQNRDLQVVLKSVQEEQKKMTDLPITPLKITRSVGMQVLMTDKNNRRKTLPGSPSVNLNPNNNATNNRTLRNVSTTGPRVPKPHSVQQSIPVPRLVPATPSAVSKPNVPQVNVTNNPGKTASPLPNGLKNSPPVQKAAEKRTHSRTQSVTVDLTDDEPPAKVCTRSTPTPSPVRLVPPQNLLASKQLPANSPRKVYIPISGQQGQTVRPGQTIMLKSVPSPGPRLRGQLPPMVRVPQNSVRVARVQGMRHPAPLPDAMKQYQPPNWKALPPAPDLKLSKVENGIVISWKIDGYQEDSYEEIASYQLYAYQETSSPPSTALWKKIGDVKALPLPMACTLTQFMAGYKYYFAVRPVDIRSRLGPFSLPGSILLLNKM